MRAISQAWGYCLSRVDRQHDDHVAHCCSSRHSDAGVSVTEQTRIMSAAIFCLAMARTLQLAILHFTPLTEPIAPRRSWKALNPGDPQHLRVRFNPGVQSGCRAWKFLHRETTWKRICNEATNAGNYELVQCMLVDGVCEYSHRVAGSSWMACGTWLCTCWS